MYIARLSNRTPRAYLMKKLLHLAMPEFYHYNTLHLQLITQLGL